MHVLDNPIWEALTSAQKDLAQGDHLARRFPIDIGPLAGMIDQSPEAYTSLAKLSKPDEQLVFFINEAAVVPEGWTLDVSKLLTQMVYEGSSIDRAESAASSIQIDELTEADIPEMLALTHLTQPGPFRQRTNTLGTYLGIHSEGRLLAMAGERLDLQGYTEISAVCTHPDAQGKGYAQALLAAVTAHILRRGKVPFLHTRPDNLSAIHVYEKLGFRTRRLLHLAVLRHD